MILIFQSVTLSTFWTQEKRIALVIGNAEYTFAPLKNPINDARLMKETLEKLDFEVIMAFNLTTQRQFLDTIRFFQRKSEDYNVRFVYYAGHAVQIGEENHFLPTMERFQYASDFTDNTVALNKITSQFKFQQNDINVVILDACRDNPLKNISEARGVIIESIANEKQAEGTLIVYATTSGATAADGKGTSKNSVFCSSLAKHMLTPDVPFEDVLKMVRRDVRESLNQKPEYYSRLENTIYLKKSDFTRSVIQIDSLIQVENYDLARELTAQILVKDPNYKKALLRKGRIEYLTKKSDYNGEHLFNADKLYPNDSEVNEYIARFYSYIGQNEKAIQTIEKAIQIDQDEADLFYWKAIFYRNSEKYELAESSFSRAIQLDSLNSDLYECRAEFYANYLHDFQKARKDFDKAIQYDINNPERFYSRYNFLINYPKEYQQALTDLNSSLDLAPLNTNYLYSRGLIYDNYLRNSELAILDFQMILKIDPKNVDAINSIGLIYKDQENWEEAIKFFNQGIELEKSNPKGAAYCYNNRAQIYESKNRLNEALNDYNKAIQLDPYNAYRYDSRYSFYLNYIGDYQMALNDVTKAIELSPNKIDYKYNRGYLYMNYLNNNSKAIEDFEEILRIDPTYVNAINSIGLIYQKIGQSEKAIEQYEQGIALENTFPLSAAYCYNNRAKIYESINKLDEALADYTRSIQLDPSNAVRYFARHNFLIDYKKDFDSALKDISKSIELESSNIEYLYARGDLLSFYDINYQKALEDFRKVLEIEPENINAINAIGLIYSKLGNLDKAIEQYNKGIEFENENPTSVAFCYNNRAEIYTQQNRLDEALLDYSNAIKLDPKNSVRYNARYYFYFNYLKDYQNALFDINRALELDPNNIEYLYNRGYLYTFYLIDNKRAIADFNTILSMDPVNINAINSLGIVYQNQGNPELAIAEYNKGITYEKYNPVSAAYCYTNRATIFEKQNKHNEAEEDYTKAISLDPKNPSRYHNRYNFYLFHKADYYKALMDINKSIELSNNNVDFLYSRGYLYAFYLRDYSKAIADFKEIIEKDSNYINAFSSLGSVYQEQGKLDLAIQILNDGLSIENSANELLAFCYANRANIYVLKNEFDNALSDFSIAISLDPKNPLRFENRGDFYDQNLNRPYDALVDYSLAISLDSTQTITWWKRGKLFSEKINDQESALKDFQKILKLKPNDINALNWSSIIYSRNHEDSLAVYGYKKILSLSDSIRALPEIIEDYGWANINLAEYLEKENNLDQALNLYNEAINYMPNFPEFYFWRGWFYLNSLGLYENAISDLSKGIELDDKNPKWYLNRALMFQKQNNQKMAKNDFDEAVKLSKGSSYFLTHRANFLSQIGEFIKADKDFESAFNEENIPTCYYHFKTDHLNRQNKISDAIQFATETLNLFEQDTISHNQLGSIFYNQKKYQKALHHFQRAVEIMENNQEFRIFDPDAEQVFLSDVYFSIALIYEELNEKDLCCEALNLANQKLSMEFKSNKLKIQDKINLKLKNCSN